jgi:hypothetical protein
MHALYKLTTAAGCLSEINVSLIQHYNGKDQSTVVDAELLAEGTRLF